jgi:hypothetical protein
LLAAVVAVGAMEEEAVLAVTWKALLELLLERSVLSLALVVLQAQALIQTALVVDKAATHQH